MSWNSSTKTPAPAPMDFVTSEFDPPTWTIEGDCSGNPPITVNAQAKTQTLYYKTNVGQAAFPMATADLYGNNVQLTADMALAVSYQGRRLIPDDGSGTVGEYTVDLGANTVSLVTASAVDDEPFIVDIFWPALDGKGPPGDTGPQGPLGGTFPDAPSDNVSYGRRNAAWNGVLSLLGGVLKGPL
jgi:hypothetical protein